MTAWDHVEGAILTWAPIIFMALICVVLWRTMKLMPRTKPQQIKPESKGSIGWDQVAGADEAKAELQEVVEFLREPDRFTQLGASVPKGILLHGPPGTGKTLLAKAVATESGAEFFSQSAASFVEMFAGLGAARIRRLFAEARDHRPAVIFIDEIDAVGGERGSDNNSEREQTLNQLLVEMDGFGTTGDVVVIAASNLLDKLDAALLRPGRFDRQIFVSPPDVSGRAAILRVHTRGKPLHEVDLELTARQTSGLTGADLANLANEAAIFAARERCERIEQRHFDDALERVVAGMQSRRTLNEHERRVVAFHEAGHALCAELLPGVNRVHKISIVPRGRALGYTLNLPEEDRYLKTREELHRLHDGAARRPRGGADRLRRDHHGRLRRPQASGGDLALDGARVRDGHGDHLASGVGRGRRGLGSHAPAARRGAAAPDRRGGARRRAARHRAPRQARRAGRRAAAQRGARARRHRPHHGGRPAPVPVAGPWAARRRQPPSGRSLTQGRRTTSLNARGCDRHPLEPAGADLAVDVELALVREVDLHHVAALVRHAALLRDRARAQAPGPAGQARA